MAEKESISEADFVAACCTVATVLAGGWWSQSTTTGRAMKRPAQTPSAAMPCPAAAKYCGFGRTRFRELVAAGVFPQPVTIEGQNRWLMKELDAALARLGKPRPRPEE